MTGQCKVCKVSAVRYNIWHLWWCPLYRTRKDVWPVPVVTVPEPRTDVGDAEEVEG